MIRLIDAQEDLEEFIALVREYTDAILQQDAAVAKTLASQHLEDELKDIEEKYSFPDGRMYILNFQYELTLNQIKLTLKP